MRRGGALVLGGVCGGALWGAVEVAGFIGKALLPSAWVDPSLISLLPPRDFPGFAAVALATYGTLGLLGGCVLALVLGRRAGRAGAGRAFALGAGLVFWGLASVAAVVWTSMVLSGALVTAHSLALFAAGIAGAGVATALLLWLPLRRVASAGRGVALAGVVAPALVLGLAWVLHARLDLPQPPERGTPRPGLPNVLFVTIDTLRADEVHVYSRGPVRTPNLDRLAHEGVRFGHAISHVPTTTPSHVSIFTSLYPFAHAAENGVPMKPGLMTLAGALRGAGYYTAAFVASFTTKSNVTGLGPAFDVYVDSLHPDIEFLSDSRVEPLVFWRLIDRMSGNQLDAAVVNRRVRNWLDRRPPQPFFVWVHYFDAHRPYDPKPEWRAKYHPADGSERERELALYRAEVSYTDDQLGQLLDAFRSRGLLENTIVVVTSDHGQGFGEPHPKYVDWSHGRWLYDSVLWVPLIFWGPGRIPAGHVVTEQVESIDIAPTVLSLAGVPEPPGFAGRSLAPTFARGDVLPGKLAFSENSSLYRPRRMSVRSPHWKLIVSPETGEEELYDLSADPGETHNVVDQRTDVARDMREKLGKIAGGALASQETNELDPETLKRLKALGYVPDE